MKRKNVIIIIVLAALAFVLLVLLSGVIFAAISAAQPKVAIIEVNGAITGAESIIKQVQTYKNKVAVKAIVLRINSPGGSVAPVQEIYDALKKVDNKIIVASMSSTAASGGYYIACAADEIFANPGTLTGSIGVIMQLITAEGLLKKVGVNSEVIKSGKFKDIGSPTRSLTEEERAILQTTISDVHAQFVDDVFETRKDKGITRQRLEEIADGRIFSGRQALEEKLIDQLGGLQDAIDSAAKLSGIEGKPRLIKQKRSKSFMEWVLGASTKEQVDKIFHSGTTFKYELYLGF